MLEKEIKIVVDTSDAEKNVKDLDKSVENFGDTAEQASKKTTKGLKDVEKQNEGVKKSSKGASIGIKAIGTALKAIGIGIVIAAVVKFTEVLTSNRKVSDALSTVFETISIVMNQFVSAIVDAIEATYEATNGFQSMQKVVMGLLTLAITPLKLQFFAIKLAVQEAQLAWEKSFFGDKDPETIKELNKAIAQTRKDLVGVGVDALKAGADVANNFVGAVNEITTLNRTAIDGIKEISITGAFEQAKANVQLKNTAELAAAQIQGLIEKYDRQAEKLRQIRDDDRKSISERIKANEELGKVLDEQQKAQTRLAQVRIASAQAELDKQKGNIEAQNELIEAQNELAAIEAQVEGFRSEQLTNRNALLREQKDILRELNEIGKSELELAKEQAAQLRDDRIEQINLQVEDEQEKNRLLLATEQAYQDELTAIDAKNAEARKEITKQETKAKEEQLASYGQALSQFSQVLGEETAAGKAFAVASALASTYQGANDALTDKTIPNTFARIAAVAAVIGTGLSNVKNILKIKVPGGGNAGASNSASATGVQGQQQQPAFNLVGRANVNQLQTGLEQQETQPLRAFVVSSDVTSQQEADRATQNQAAFG